MNNNYKIMTLYGWEDINKITKDHLIYTIDNNGKVILSQPEEIITEKYNGYIYSVNNDTTNIIYPQNYSIYGTSDKQNYGIRMISELIGKKYFMRKYLLNTNEDTIEPTFKEYIKYLENLESNDFYKYASKLSYSQARRLLHNYLNNCEYSSYNIEMVNRVEYLLFLSGLTFKRVEKKNKKIHVKMLNHGFCEINKDDYKINAINNYEITRLKLETNVIFVKHNNITFWSVSW